MTQSDPSAHLLADAVLTSVQAVLQSEGSAVLALADRLATQAEALRQVCALIFSRCSSQGPGRLVVTGVGKAGLIGRKLAATFASTGTPACFLHPAEAQHGDLGMVTTADVVLALSNSGASDEVLAILPALRDLGCPLIALVGRSDAPLLRQADAGLIFGPVAEACPLGLAPSTSTTAMLALGDALALTIMRQRGFGADRYAKAHPGGALGRTLMTCAEAMRPRARTPAVAPGTSVADALRTITAARAGSVVLIDDADRVLGIFTDGDLRRALTRSPREESVLTVPVRALATCPCTTVAGDALVHTALTVCARKQINELPVVAADGRLIGLIDVQDLADRGFAV